MAEPFSWRITCDTVCYRHLSWNFDLDPHNQIASSPAGVISASCNKIFRYDTSHVWIGCYPGIRNRCFCKCQSGTQSGLFKAKAIDLMLPISEFQIHPAQEVKAFRIIYTLSLERDRAFEKVRYARKPKKQPMILSLECLALSQNPSFAHATNRLTNHFASPGA